MSFNASKPYRLKLQSSSSLSSYEVGQRMAWRAGLRDPLVVPDHLTFGHCRPDRTCSS